MRKFFLDAAAGVKYWDDFLNKGTAEILNFKYNKYVTNFDRYIKKGNTILEGGCGAGQYAAYYANKDFRVTGVDYSFNLVRRSRNMAPAAEFTVADVRKLPFKKESFDIYISNGVLEHLEDGPDKALCEAARVLRRGGLFLVTVQAINGWRRLAGMAGAIARKGDDGYNYFQGAFISGKYKVVRDFNDEHNKNFHSYFFTPSEYKASLERTGFNIKDISFVSVENGLGDISFFRNAKRRSGSTAQAGPAHKALPENKKNIMKEWLKEAFVKEDPRSPIGVMLLKLAQPVFGSMLFAVCEKT